VTVGQYTFEYLLGFNVLGVPVPQGALRSFGKGRATVHKNQDRLLPWRDTVQFAAEKAIADHETPEIFPLGEGVGVAVATHFTINKAGSAPRTRVTYPTKWPDIDKLVRSILDSLRPAGVYLDDKQVIWNVSSKVYPGEEGNSLHVPGVKISVWRVELSHVVTPEGVPLDTRRAA